MPTYDYVCEACGREFEHFQAMSDRHLRTCPTCGKKKLIRKVGAGAGLIFKGSGFYVNDYRKGGSPGSDAKPSETQGEKPAGKPGGGSEGASGGEGGAPARSSDPRPGGSDSRSGGSTSKSGDGAAKSGGSESKSEGKPSGGTKKKSDA